MTFIWTIIMVMTAIQAITMALLAILAALFIIIRVIVAAVNWIYANPEKALGLAKIISNVTNFISAVTQIIGFFKRG